MAHYLTHFDTGDDLCRYMVKVSPVVMLGFSAGKDSIASWLQLHRHGFKVVPFYRELIPGLAMTRRSLAYYEDYFKTKILVYPQPSFFGRLDRKELQPPWRLRLVDALDIPRNLSYLNDDIRKAVKDIVGADVWSASGWRRSDSFRRAMVLKKYGSLRERDRNFYPIFDWTQQRIVDECRRVDLKMPVDYRLFSRSFEAFDFRFFEPMVNCPDPVVQTSVKQIRAWFPLVDAELARIRFYRENPHVAEAEQASPVDQEDLHQGPREEGREGEEGGL